MTFIFSLLPLAIASSAKITAAFVELDSLLHLSHNNYLKSTYTYTFQKQNSFVKNIQLIVFSKNSNPSGNSP